MHVWLAKILSVIKCENWNAHGHRVCGKNKTKYLKLYCYDALYNRTNDKTYSDNFRCILQSRREYR